MNAYFCMNSVFWLGISR